MQNLVNKRLILLILSLSLLVISTDMVIEKAPLRGHSASLKPMAFSIQINDTSIGNFTMDIDNDPPVFIDWFDSTSLIPPNDDVLFWAVVEDIDNTSGELTVILYYSDDSFVADNSSVTLVYFSSPAISQYRFIAVMLGQTAGTYYQYYYTAFDGNTTITENNNGLYYDIQWQTVSVGGAGFRPKPPEVVPAFFKLITDPAVFGLIVVIIFLAVILAVLSKYLREKSRQKDLRMGSMGITVPNKLPVKILAFGAVAALLVSFVFLSTFTNYTTFEYEGEFVNWRIGSTGMIDSNSIFYSVESIDNVPYTQYSVSDEPNLRPIDFEQAPETIEPHTITYNIAFDFDNDSLTNEALWVETELRSDGIRFLKMIIYDSEGVLVREYQQAPSTSGIYNIFLYQREITHLIRGGVTVKYIGEFIDNQSQTKPILSIYFNLALKG